MDSTLNAPETKDATMLLDLTLCVPTFRRPALLSLLLGDLVRQRFQPGRLVVVDGDPGTGEVLGLLKQFAFPSAWNVILVPSDHPNLAYQRYLGWRSAKEQRLEVLLYLDDDLRLLDERVLERILEPFGWDSGYVGVTASTASENRIEKLTHAPSLLDHSVPNTSFLVSRFGESRKYQPGSVTPYGSKVRPDFSGELYTRVEWLQGRVMAYRMNALDSSVFSEDLFALTHIHCGLGEDTFLSHNVSLRGEMVMLRDAHILHPDDALPNSYPVQSYSYAYATAYSRRLLNDHFRITEGPRLGDRLALVKSYIGNNVINLAYAVTRPRRHRWAYAAGYLVGSLRGLIQPPTAANLTPDIDWAADAENALAAQVVIQ